jgi:hypothetical protein
MTSLTTILGMVPIAFFPGAGAETIQPIGKTFVGGLSVSTLMTLFVTPVMYSILNGRRDKKRGAGSGGAGRTPSGDPGGRDVTGGFGFGEGGSLAAFAE